MNCDAVSAVSPDLLITLTIVFLIFGVIELDDRLDLVRIDVVEHEQLRPGACRSVMQVVGVGVERVLERDVAQGAAADAQDDQDFAVVAEVLDLAC